MKLSSSSKGKTPFVKKDKLEIYVTTAKGKITQYEIHNGSIKIVKVKENNFLAAWKEVEKHLKQL